MFKPKLSATVHHSPAALYSAAFVWPWLIHPSTSWLVHYLFIDSLPTLLNLIRPCPLSSCTRKCCAIWCICFSSPQCPISEKRPEVERWFDSKSVPQAQKDISLLCLEHLLLPPIQMEHLITEYPLYPFTILYYILNYPHNLNFPHCGINKVLLTSHTARWYHRKLW